MEPWVRSSSVSLARCNQAKQEVLSHFIAEYRSAVQHFVSYLWTTRIEWGSPGHSRVWDRAKGALALPSMISTVGVSIETELSARALKCAATQACGIVGAVVRKRVKDLALGASHEKAGRPIPDRLKQRVAKEMTCPECTSLNCELNSLVVTYKDKLNTKLFDGWITLTSLFKPEIRGRGYSLSLPICKHRQFRKWEASGGERLSGILLNEHSATFRFQFQPVKQAVGHPIAIDQGYVTCITASDGQASVKDLHGYDLTSILGRLAQRQKGSKGFQRTVQHRKNYINWAVNQLNLSGVSEVKLEKIVNINYGHTTGRKMSHWTNTLIRDSLAKRCEETGVLFTLVPNEFNSQRCSCCGWTQKANRKGKLFLCKRCGFREDADFNATQNILTRDDLFCIPFEFRLRRFNLKGFYWNSDGLFSKDGEELTVPHGQ